MTARLFLVSSILPLMLLVPFAAAFQNATTGTPDSTLVDRAVAAELRTAQDTHHPMRYRLRKSSPRMASTKDICETKDGAVALLLAVNDQPLSMADEQKEQTRLNALLSDPSKQRHRKQSEQDDTARAMKVLRALPKAFIFHFEGAGTGPTGRVEKFTFKPNPDFNPPDLETEVLTAMTGELWIDASEERITRLEGHLQQDVDFGWGILGRLNKGGWIVIEQSDVGDRQWRIVRFQMVMSGRVLFKTRSFDTLEEESNFRPVSVGMGYVQAIKMLRAGSEAAVQSSR